MSTIGNDYTSLFNSLYSSNSTSNSSSASDLLSNWASLKNGSYGKLTKAYYKKTDSKVADVEKEAAKETIKSNNKVKTTAQDLKGSLSKVEDTESLKKFVANYNAALDAGGDSDSKSILRNTLSITKLTASHQKVLASVGITIGEDNKLSLDEETAGKASKGALDSIFKGMGSYGDLVASRASELVNKANYENNKLSTYNQAGSYSGNGSIGNIYDGSY